MKSFRSFLFMFPLCLNATICSQQRVIVPELSLTSIPDVWMIHNRELRYDGAVHLDARPGAGLLVLREPVFHNGKIELDVRGRDQRGNSFVGVAFHVQNDSIYDAVCFRPFNFRDPGRSGHSVQYVSHPRYTWRFLRERYPGVYESSVAPVPDPDDWFHVTVDIRYPEVNVFVNRAKVPSLVVEQLSSRKQGWIGFWVGDNSGGSFRNLEIKPDPQ